MQIFPLVNIVRFCDLMEARWVKRLYPSKLKICFWNCRYLTTYPLITILIWVNKGFSQFTGHKDGHSWSRHNPLSLLIIRNVSAWLRKGVSLTQRGHLIGGKNNFSSKTLSDAKTFTSYVHVRQSKVGTHLYPWMLEKLRVSKNQRITPLHRISDNSGTLYNRSQKIKILLTISPQWFQKTLTS